MEFQVLPIAIRLNYKKKYSYIFSLLVVVRIMNHSYGLNFAKKKEKKKDVCNPLYVASYTHPVFYCAQEGNNSITGKIA